MNSPTLPEPDPECSADANLQHPRHLIEGYRSTILRDGGGSPYPPGSARDVSWNEGAELAAGDPKAVAP